MNDHSTSPNPLDLTSRLNRIKKSHSEPNNGDAIDRLPRFHRRGGGTPSSAQDEHDNNHEDESECENEMPPFTKSSTMSTQASSDSRKSRMAFAQSQSFPLSAREGGTRNNNADKAKRRIAPLGRRKGSGGGRRRTSHESAKSAEFRYYGRHANSWLFNDFSVTEAVAKGWGKVVGGGGGRGGKE